MQTNVLNAEIRTEKGKNASHRLRKEGYIPAVLYSHGISETLKIQEKDLFNLFKGKISESILIDLNITNKEGDSSHKAFVKDYQRDVITEKILHLDFYKIKMDEKVQTSVPIEIVGTSPGVKMGGILEVMLREIDIKCLPMELPEKIPIDITNLTIGSSFYIKDLNLSSSIEIMNDPDRVMISVLSPQKVEIEEEVVEPEEEVSETMKKEPEEMKEETTK